MKKIILGLMLSMISFPAFSDILTLECNTVDGYKLEVVTSTFHVLPEQGYEVRETFKGELVKRYVAWELVSNEEFFQIEAKLENNAVRIIEFNFETGIASVQGALPSKTFNICKPEEG